MLARLRANPWQKAGQQGKLQAEDDGKEDVKKEIDERVIAMAIRPANSVSILQKRLTQAEAGGCIDVMELIGIHDELARIERKWIVQVQEGNDRRRPTTDSAKLDDWYRRLSLLIERALRSPAIDGTVEADALRKTAAAVTARPAFPSAAN